MNGEMTWTIGRSKECDIRFEDGTASRRHATLTLVVRGSVQNTGVFPPRWLLADAGSSRGTRVSGRMIRGGQSLRPTDVVEFGAMRIMALQPGTPGRNRFDA